MNFRARRLIVRSLSFLFIIIPVLCAGGLVSGTCSAASELPVLRVGVSLDFRPYDFVDKDGQPTGFTVELITAIAEKMGLRARFITGPWDRVWDGLVAGQLDVLPTVTRTVSREALVDFSVPHTETFDAFFVREGQPPIKDIAAAAGKEIVVSRSDAAHHQLLERKFAGKLILVETFPEGLRLIAAGQHDAMLCSKLVGVLEGEQAGIKDVKSGPPIPDYKRVFSFAVHKGNTELLEKLNQGLAIVKADGTYDRLYRKWLGAEIAPLPKWHQYFWPVVVLIAVLAMCFVAWHMAREAAKWDERLLRVLAPQVLVQLPAAWRYALAVAIVVAATALRVALIPWLGTVAPYNIALVATVVATMLLGSGPGLLVMVGSDIAVELFVLGMWPVLFEGKTLTRLGLSTAVGVFVVFAIHAARVAAFKAHESAARLQMQRKRMPIGCIVFDEHNCFRQLNPAAEAIFGYSEAELLGRHANVIVPEATRHHVDAIMPRLSEGDMTAHSVNENITKDGRTILCQWTNTPLRDITGRHIGFLSMVQDVTEAKRAEEALRESRAKLEAALASMTEAIFIADAEGRFSDFNDAFITYHRFKDREECSKSIADCPHYIDAYFEDGTLAPADMWAMPRALRGETGSNIEYRLRKKDTGETWWGSYNFGPLRDTDGRVVGAVVAGRDITERKRAEEALQKAYERAAWLARLPEQNPNPVMRASADGTVLYCNPACAKLHGWKSEVGKALPKELSSLVSRAMAQGSVQEDVQLNGRVYIVWVEPFSGDGYANIYGRDITERKRAEEAVQKNKEKFEILSETASRLLATDEPQKLVNELCQKVMTFLDCHAFFNYLVDEEKGRLHLNAYTGIPEETGKEIEWLDYGVAVCGCAARDACRIVAEDIPNTPDVRTELVKSFGIKAYACHPLFSSGRVMGTLSFGTRSRTTFTEEELLLMKTVADQVAIAMERIRLIEALRKSRHELEIRVQERTLDLAAINEQLSTEIEKCQRAEIELRKSENRLRDLSTALLSAQERERKMIAQEIHDSMGASLAATKFKVESVLKEMGEGNPQTKAALESVVPIIQGTIEEARRIQMSLRPSMLDDLGILATINWFCRQYESIYPATHVKKEIDIQEHEVPESLKIVIYRILQEALNNIAKHSKASVVLLYLRKAEQAIQLVIRDSGQGFDLEEASSRKGSAKGLGLDSMRERAELSGGSFLIESSKGAGTVIRASWPLNN